MMIMSVHIHNFVREPDNGRFDARLFHSIILTYLRGSLDDYLPAQREGWGKGKNLVSDSRKISAQAELKIFDFQ